MLSLIDFSQKTSQRGRHKEGTKRKPTAHHSSSNTHLHDDAAAPPLGRVDGTHAPVRQVLHISELLEVEVKINLVCSRTENARGGEGEEKRRRIGGGGGGVFRLLPSCWRVGGRRRADNPFKACLRFITLMLLLLP